MKINKERRAWSTYDEKTFINNGAKTYGLGFITSYLKAFNNRKSWEDLDRRAIMKCALLQKNKIVYKDRPTY